MVAIYLELLSRLTTLLSKTLCSYLTWHLFLRPEAAGVVRADLAHKPSSHMNFLVGQLQGPSEAEKQGVRMVTRSILIRVLA